MRGISTSLILSLILLVGFFSLSAYTVYEPERAIVSRLGKLMAEDRQGHSCQFLKVEKNLSAIAEGACKPLVIGPGLHFKVPLLDSISILDSRLLLSLVSSERIPTKEKKDVIVDLFVKWRIEDFGLFYLRTNNQKGAELLLKQKVVDGLRAAFGQRTIKELVSGREKVMEQLKKDTNSNAHGLGIEVMDVRIKRIDFPPEVSEAVYKRMRTDRETAAVQLRANGESEAEKIRAGAEKEKRIILAEANKTAEELRGKGDAAASEIYAKAYSQAPEFFEFYRSLEAYKKSFKGMDDILVLEPNSDFFKFFHNKKLTNK